MAHDHTDEGPIRAADGEGSVMLLAVISLVVGVVACSLGQAGSADHGSPTPHSQSAWTPALSQRGFQGAVASGTPEASKAAIAVLEKGGNAFDAFVAASFVAAVVRPGANGLGGGGFLVYHTASGESGCLDGRETAPGSAHAEMYLDKAGEPTEERINGPRSGGVPGLVRLLHQTYQQHGSKKIPWSELIAPALSYARHGFEVPAPTTRYALPSMVKARRAVLARYPSSRSLFLPGGQPLGAGGLFKQLDLAKTLESISRDPDALYTGDVAILIANSEAEISKADLANYEVKERAPVTGTYRGFTIISMPPPSSGGTHVVQMLNLLEGYPLGDMDWHSSKHIHLLTEVMRRAFADRSKHMGDPDFSEVPTDWLISKDYANRLRESISLTHATPSSQVAPGVPPLREGDHTMQISIVDGEGNAVSVTQTHNRRLGSCYVIPGSGILLNDEMDDFAAKPGAANEWGLVQGEKNSIAPGKRPLSSMSPVIILGRDGKVWAVLGSPGGPKIITAVLQVISNLIDFGMPLNEAIAAPRIHHQWLPDRLLIEPGSTSEELLRQLSVRYGHLQVEREPEQWFGDVHAVLVPRNGAKKIAASDHRRHGGAAAH